MTTTTKKRNWIPKNEEKKEKLNQGVGIGVGTTSAVLVLVGGKFSVYNNTIYPIDKKYSSDLISFLAGMAKFHIIFGYAIM